MAYTPHGRVENFTNAFLVTLGVTLFMSFWVIAAAFGYIWMIATAYGINQFFHWIGRRRTA